MYSIQIFTLRGGEDTASNEGRNPDFSQMPTPVAVILGITILSFYSTLP